MRRLARQSLLMLTALAVGSPAFAWGPQGHRVIAKVAVDRLTPAARAAIRELLHPGDTLPDIAGWADHEEAYKNYPRSGPWHYINVPITADRYDSARDCKDGENVVSKIKTYRKILGDRAASKADRQDALLFLVHFVSDVHQPLHVGDNRDHGGNDTQVQFFGQGTNLHRLWDSDLIHKVGGNDQAWVNRGRAEDYPRVRQGVVERDRRGLGRREPPRRQARLSDIGPWRPVDGQRGDPGRALSGDGRAGPHRADGPRRGPPRRRVERDLPVSRGGACWDRSAGSDQTSAVRGVGTDDSARPSQRERQAPRPSWQFSAESRPPCSRRISEAR